MDSKHELAEAQADGRTGRTAGQEETRGPGGQQARSRREDREDGRPGADGRTGRTAGQEETGGSGGWQARSKEGFWAG